MPLIFGLAFLGPLCAEILTLTGWTDMAGISALAIGIAIGGSWGPDRPVAGALDMNASPPRRQICAGRNR